MPERWLEKKGNENGNTVKGDTRQPYFPFNIGPRSCVMLTFAHILWKFDLCRADATEDWSNADHTPPPEYMLQDHVTGQKEGPILKLRARV
ncbi:benzoate 4-monooxygenase cytochrome P450 [Colletotrichum tofieldiae]|uniref:Benzoate 4-monooxygenase cytochrome P450 n=1 Tax=Colletotrichum tofieldiae TaxID=708197 RepID=A0A166Q9Z0_9PEZI|nr:benzoate 4-monooxygenase cytochrome P450 [Colletotrichum tofieldiae]